VLVREISDQEMDDLVAEDSEQAARQDDDDSIVDGIFLYDDEGRPTITLRRSLSPADAPLVFAHELGHLVWDTHLTAGERGRFTAAYKQSKSAKRLVTDYAGESAEEGWAEAFSFFVLKPDTLRRPRPARLRHPPPDVRRESAGAAAAGGPEALSAAAAPPVQGVPRRGGCGAGAAAVIVIPVTESGAKRAAKRPFATASRRREGCNRSGFSAVLARPGSARRIHRSAVPFPFPAIPSARNDNRAVSRSLLLTTQTNTRPFASVLATTSTAGYATPVSAARTSGTSPGRTRTGRPRSPVWRRYSDSTAWTGVANTRCPFRWMTPPSPPVRQPVHGGHPDFGHPLEDVQEDAANRPASQVWFAAFMFRFHSLTARRGGFPGPAGDPPQERFVGDGLPQHVLEGGPCDVQVKGQQIRRGLRAARQQRFVPGRALADGDHADGRVDGAQRAGELVEAARVGCGVGAARRPLAIDSLPTSQKRTRTAFPRRAGRGAGPSRRRRPPPVGVLQ
jgi:hypothetical protein